MSSSLEMVAKNGKLVPNLNDFWSDFFGVKGKVIDFSKMNNVAGDRNAVSLIGEEVGCKNIVKVWIIFIKQRTEKIYFNTGSYGTFRTGILLFAREIVNFSSLVFLKLSDHYFLHFQTATKGYSGVSMGNLPPHLSPWNFYHILALGKYKISVNFNPEVPYL